LRGPFDRMNEIYRMKLEPILFIQFIQSK
jgi:hypothetical protein